MTVKQVCVIGAGVSGLIAAKTFLEEGYEVTVFEKKTGLGGVWEKSRSYPGLTIQSPRDTYAIPDYPMPPSYPEWPTAEQMRNYLESYAQHFGVAPRIRFQAEVMEVNKKSAEQPGWVVNIKFADDLSEETRYRQYEFDFVIICNGIFSIPQQPCLLGREEFIASGGQILHSTEFNSASIVDGKRVIVVGFGKSATDIATVAADVASECTLIYRQIPWKIPRFFLGVVNIKYILLTRFSEAWLPYRHLQGLEWVLHTFGKPLVWAFWRLNEILLRLQLGLDSCGMLPDKPLNKWVVSTIGLESRDFFKYVRSQKIQAVRTEIAKFIPGGVELTNGEQLSADVVVFGTGFQQDIPFLAPDYRQRVIDEQGNFHLYRNLIHPNISDLGFVGYNSSKFCPLTSHIGSQWLVEYFQRNLVLPSLTEMLQEMEVEYHWKKTEWESGLVNGTSIFPFSFHYIEELIRDMGITSNTKSWKQIAEIMLPVAPSAYKNLRQELRAKKYLTTEQTNNYTGISITNSVP